MERLRILLSQCSIVLPRTKSWIGTPTEELRSHIDFAIEENLMRGMSREEARTAALRQFGGVTQTKEDLRKMRGLPFLEVSAQDVRYGLRQLRNSPGFTITAVITLALGIGANTAIFTLVHGVLERSLPVADPSHLYRVGAGDTCCYYDGFENDNGDFDLFPYDLYLQLQHSSPEFEQLAALQAGGSAVSVRSGSSPAKPLRSEYVSGNYFSMLGVGSYAGRPLLPSDDKPGATPVLVLSYQSWQSDFAGDASIVGSTVEVQTHPFIVAGIAPPGFFGDRVVERPPDIWVPLANEPMIEGREHFAVAPGKRGHRLALSPGQSEAGDKHRHTPGRGFPRPCVNGWRRTLRSRPTAARRGFPASMWSWCLAEAASRDCSSKLARDSACS